MRVIIAIILLVVANVAMSAPVPVISVQVEFGASVPVADIRQDVLGWDIAMQGDKSATVLARSAVEVLVAHVPIFSFCVQDAPGCSADYVVLIKIVKNAGKLGLRCSLLQAENAQELARSPSGNLEHAPSTPNMWATTEWWTNAVRKWASDYLVRDLLVNVPMSVPLEMVDGHISIPGITHGEWRLGSVEAILRVKLDAPAVPATNPSYLFRTCEDQSTTGVRIGGDAHKPGDRRKPIPCSAAQKIGVSGHGNAVQLVDIRPPDSR